MRLGTLYGWSPRMRYDIAINKIIRDMVFLKKIEILGGTQLRFFCYNLFACKVINKLINEKSKKKNSKIFNTCWKRDLDKITDKDAQILIDQKTKNEQIAKDKVTGKWNKIHVSNKTMHSKFENIDNLNPWYFSTMKDLRGLFREFSADEKHPVVPLRLDTRNGEDTNFCASWVWNNKKNLLDYFGGTSFQA